MDVEQLTSYEATPTEYTPTFAGNAEEETPFIRRPIERLRRSTRCSTSAGRSSRRSRSGGISRVKTATTVAIPTATPRMENRLRPGCPSKLRRTMR